MELIIALVAIAVIGIAIYVRNNRAEVQAAEITAEAPYKVETPEIKVEAVNAKPVEVKAASKAKALTKKAAPKAKAPTKKPAVAKPKAPAKPKAKKPAATKAPK
jgi:Flp pilus assembly protein CpaB